MNYVYKEGIALQHEIEQTVVPDTAVALWQLGQAGVVIKGSVPASDTGSVPMVAVDPFLSGTNRAENPDNEFIREYNPPIEPEQLSQLTAVLITHHHGDHLDTKTITRLHRAAEHVKFVVPAPHAQILRNAGVADEVIISARAGEKLELPGVGVLPIAAAHTVYEQDEAGDHLYLGYLIDMNGISIYHSGDTVVTDALMDTVVPLRPQIAILPVNGSDYERTRRNIVGNMSAREAVDFAVAIKADLLLPNHYDMFPNNRDNPAHFVDYLFHQQRQQKFHMLAVGERFIYLP